MSHPVATREDWLKARLELLKEEKELTRRSDELAKKRQALPWVKVEKPYQFETDNGTASLADLFQGRSQLAVYHFMFGPDYAAGCPSCSSIADEFDGIATHLANHDVTLMAISRAPLAKLKPYKKRMGWNFPWASSGGSSFNSDFQVSSTPEEQRAGKNSYNFGPGFSIVDMNPPPEMLVQLGESCGTDAVTYTCDLPGMSTFVLQDGVVYHCYSAYARGLDVLWNVYQWLDRAPLGRNEKGPWMRRHDEYATQLPMAGACCQGE